jgi:Ca2+ transporting ATPase
MCVFERGKDDVVSINMDDHPNLNKIEMGINLDYNEQPVKFVSKTNIDIIQLDVKMEDLKELMQLKGVEAVEKLNHKYSGAEMLAKMLKTSFKTGISGEKEDMNWRADTYGRNEIPAQPSKSIFRLAFEACRDPTLIMLMICAVISIGLSFYHPSTSDDSKKNFRLGAGQKEQNLEWIEGVAIIVAVALVVCVTAFNDWRKERQFRGLQDKIESDNLTSVVRNGQVTQIHIKSLLVGDICCVKYGDTIPADGVVVEASDLKIDEASLTGETDLVKKDTTQNVVILSGTHVMEGSGQFLVLAVGVNSQTGIIMTLLGATQEESKSAKDKKKDAKKKKNLKKGNIFSSFYSQTYLFDNYLKEAVTDKPESLEKPNEEVKPKKQPRKRKYPKKHLSVLQVKLGKLALKIGYCGITGAMLTFVVLVVRMSIVEFGIKKNAWSNNYIKYFMNYLIQAITVIVVAVPEGLPLAVTLALAFAVRVHHFSLFA